MYVLCGPVNDVWLRGPEGSKDKAYSHFFLFKISWTLLEGQYFFHITADIEKHERSISVFLVKLSYYFEINFLLMICISIGHQLLFLMWTISFKIEKLYILEKCPNFVGLAVIRGMIMKIWGLLIYNHKNLNKDRFDELTP